MSWIGEYQLGDRLPLTLWVRSSDSPTLPDNPPRAIIYSGTKQIENFLLPVVDQPNETALFRTIVNLDGKYSTGKHLVQFIYALSSVIKSEVDSFEILPGGNVNGTGLSMDFFTVNPNRYVLVHTDIGSLVRRKNPMVTK
jgi:hypothetical protein